jgi:hypothetical protein
MIKIKAARRKLTNDSQIKRSFPDAVFSLDSSSSLADQYPDIIDLPANPRSAETGSADARGLREVR